MSPQPTTLAGLVEKARDFDRVYQLYNSPAFNQRTGNSGARVRGSTTEDPVQINLSSTPQSSQQQRGPISQAERERRFKDKLCLYCGKPGHIRQRMSCQEKPETHWYTTPKDSRREYPRHPCRRNPPRQHPDLDVPSLVPGPIRHWNHSPKVGAPGFLTYPIAALSIRVVSPLSIFRYNFLETLDSEHVPASVTRNILSPSIMLRGTLVGKLSARQINARIANLGALRLFPNGYATRDEFNVLRRVTRRMKIVELDWKGIGAVQYGPCNWFRLQFVLPRL